MSIYVFVHGGWHGSWCWKKVVPLLREKGHSVFAPDLPGHGEDKMPLAAITPERVMQCIYDILDEQEEQVILVGHSSGGMLITEAARRRPEKIKALVYLAAFLLPAGVFPPSIMREDHESILPSSLIIDEERKVSIVRPEDAREVFYADCSDEDATWATALLVAEPLKVGTSSEISATEVDIDWIPRAYITSLQDKALGPATQKKMYTMLPCRKVYELATSHSPFLSTPEQVVACLLDVALLCE